MTYYDPLARTGHQATSKKDHHHFPQDCPIAAFLSPSPSCTGFRHNAMAMAARRGFQLGCTDLRVEESAGPSSTTQKGIAFVICSNLFCADLRETVYGVMALFCAIYPDGGPSWSCNVLTLYSQFSTHWQQIGDHCSSSLASLPAPNHWDHRSHVLGVGQQLQLPRSCLPERPKKGSGSVQ
jgi:hypothetical protein